MSAATLAILYWIIKIIGASLVAVAAALGLAQRVDRQRQGKAPPILDAAGTRAANRIQGLIHSGPRRAGLFAAAEFELVARLRDVIDRMHTGDVLLFAGRKLHSYINRIACWTRMSHCAMVYRDTLGRVWAAEVVEGFRIYFTGWRPRIDLGGFRMLPIEEYVAKYPGQLYWAPLSKEFDKPAEFNRQLCRCAIDASVGWKYGWRGIGLQLLTKTPFVRVVTYLLTWKRIDVSWNSTRPPFCSWAVSEWATKAGQDPTPRLAPQLTTPAEIERSKLWGEPIALVPDDFKRAA